MIQEKLMFLRLAPWMGVRYPHPQDIPYAFDIAQCISFLDSSRYRISFIDGLIESLKVDDYINRLLAFNPDIVALSTTSSASDYAVEILRLVN
jgi:hypothetical protein